LFTTKQGWNNFISGVIMYEETLYQKTKDGVSFVEVLKNNGILTGIKVDKGLVVLPGTDGEQSTTGLDGLGARCAEYYKQGARFAKWRAVIKITDSLPSDLAVQETAHTLARYAATCQENGLVPIVEPECLMDGTHSLQRCADVTERVLNAVYRELYRHNVLLEGTLLKPNMVTAGHESADYKKTTPTQIANATVTVLKRTVPPAVPGIMFLSGGQDEEEATLNLNAMNQDHHLPWSLSFSFGRALQHSCQKAWLGKPENFTHAQEVFYHRAQCNSQAQFGKYVPSKGTDGQGQSLYVKDYTY